MEVPGIQLSHLKDLDLLFVDQPFLSGLSLAKPATSIQTSSFSDRLKVRQFSLIVPDAF